MSTTEKPDHPPADLARRIHSRLRLHGDNLTAWAMRHGITVATAHAAVNGTRRGPVASAALARLLAHLGL